MLLSKYEFDPHAVIQHAELTQRTYLVVVSARGSNCSRLLALCHHGEVSNYCRLFSPLLMCVQAVYITSSASHNLVLTVLRMRCHFQPLSVPIIRLMF